MFAEEALRQLLTENAAFAAVIGTRCYPLRAPEDAGIPYSICWRWGGERAQHLKGPSGLAAADIEIQFWARTYREARRAADLARLALHGYAGIVEGDGDELDVGTISLLEDEDCPPELYPAAGSGLHGVRQRYTVWHQETVPTFPV